MDWILDNEDYLEYAKILEEHQRNLKVMAKFIRWKIERIMLKF